MRVALPRPLIVLAALLILASCARQGRLDAVEARLVTLEEAQARDRADLAVTLTRLSDTVQMLARALDVIDDDGLRDQLELLARQVEALEKQAARKAARRAVPATKDVYAVPVAGAASEGPADALVTIVRAYEYACPYCERSRATFATLRQKYPDELRIVHRSFIVHPQQATVPARAACAAHRQGKFAAFDALMWDKGFKHRAFERADVEAFASEAGLDLATFRADLDGACVAQVERDQADLAQVGVGATPAHFINGRFLPGGAVAADKFEALIDEELATARARLAQTSKKARKQFRATYYQRWVIERGLAAFDRDAATND